jgi:hypothetical protein
VILMESAPTLQIIVVNLREIFYAAAESGGRRMGFVIT